MRFCLAATVMLAVHMGAGAVRKGDLEYPEIYRVAALAHFTAWSGDEPADLQAAPATWPNGALGLPRPGEISTQALVGGLRIAVCGKRKPERAVEYRAGPRQVRVARGPEKVDVAAVDQPRNAPPKPLDLFRAAAVGHYVGLKGESPAEVKSEAAEWPDGALGLARPGEISTQAIVPGFRITLRGPEGRPLEYRGGGRQVRVRVSRDRIDVVPLNLALEPKDPERVRPAQLTMTRIGGIAGFGDRITIQRDGSWRGMGKRGEQTGRLDAARLALVREFLNGDLWKKHRGGIGVDPRIRDAMAFGFEVRSATGSLGKLVLHDLDKAPAPVYRQLATLVDLLYTP